jgi:Tfp pilus assembly protein PilE
MSATVPERLHERGFSYVEVLVATVLLTVGLAPALESLREGVVGGEIHAALTADHYHLTAKMEEILAQPFGALEAAATAAGSPTVPTTYSDTAGDVSRRLVYVAGYDGDDADGDGHPFTGADDGLLWVKVEIENTTFAVASLTSR